MSMIGELLKKFKLNSIKEINTPMHPTTSLGLKKESKLMNNSLYTQMIDSLLYLTTSRPNIMFSFYLCAYFQSDPKDDHLMVVK